VATLDPIFYLRTQSAKTPRIARAGNGAGRVQRDIFWRFLPVGWIARFGRGGWSFGFITFYDNLFGSWRLP